MRRCRWFSFRQPPALPRTGRQLSLSPSPPEPVTSNSPRLPCLAALPTGLPLACAFSRPFGPASNRVCTRPSQARPPNLIVCPCPPALPSDQPPACAFSLSSGPASYSDFNLRCAELFRPSLRLLLVRSFSGCRCCWACAQPSRSRLQDIALRPSLRLCPQTESPLQACALRLRSTLRPPSGLRSTPACAFVSCCLPASPLADSLRGPALASRPDLESALWQCHPAGTSDSWPGPCGPCLSSSPSLRDCLSGLRLRFQPPGIGPEACSDPPCTRLAACASRLGQILRPGPPGSRSSGLAPFLIRPATEPRPRSACASCFFCPALWSCLGVPAPLNPGLRLHSVSGSSVPSWFLRTSSSGAFQIALPLRACALCFRSILRPAFRFRLRLAPSARPSSCLRRVPTGLRPSAHPPAPPRACRFFMTLGLRLVPCQPAPFESSQRPTAWSSVARTLGTGYLCTQVQIK